METFGLKTLRIHAVLVALVCSRLTAGDIDVWFASPGQSISLRCPYSYEDHSSLPELSVQWKNPQNQLLCHFVKHKSYLNCSGGYQLHYSPRNITLTVAWVQEQDYGTHLCTVGKRHEFTDRQVELSRQTQTESVTPVPGRGVALTAPCWTLLLLLCTWWLVH